MAYRRRTFPPRAALTLAVAAVLSRGVVAQSTETLKRMSLQELMNVEVTTLSREAEPSVYAPAAVFVITREDIRRSGATSIPEALRLAPGMQVARIDASRWAIGLRGFADRLARSMLVLMDGRAVYSPLFAGTYWEVQDTVLEDIERIEVIRGPGGTLWGANAVNGIINIVTKKASETQGTLVRVGGGSLDSGMGVFRYGAPVSANGSIRGYVKGFERSDLAPDGYDGWHMIQGGFRGDWTLGGRRSFTLQGDVYAGRLGQRAVATSYTRPYSVVSVRDSPVSGGNVLARWGGRIGKSDVEIQTYYDRTRRDERPVAETRDTFDLDFQQHRRWRGRHDAMWGLGYRVSAGRIEAIAPTEFIPTDRTDSLYSAFVQDDIALVSDGFRMILGGKVEHNAYSGFEFQPSGRLLWTLNPSNTIIGSVTRAVRTPSRVETDYTTTSLVNPAVPSFVRLIPNPDFRPEQLVAYELIYRVKPVEQAYVTFSGFFNQLDELLSTELFPSFYESAPAPTRQILPVSFLNGLHGNSRGFEVTADVRPASWWRSTMNYSYLRIQVERDPGGRDVSQERRYEGLSPRHQLQLQTGVDVTPRISLDWTWRYISELPAGPVPAYGTSNVRVSWRPGGGIELALNGKDLQSKRHVEWPTGSGSNVPIERSVFVGLTWRQPG